MSKFRKTKCQTESSDSDSDDEADQFTDRWESYKYTTVVVLDNTGGMFEACDEDDNCHFKMTLLACLKLLERYLFRSYRHTLAVTLLSQEDIKPIVAFGDHILDSVQKLLDLTKLSNKELKEKYCADTLNENQLYSTLMDVASMFNRDGRYVKKSKKSISIVTNEADPNRNDDNEDLRYLADRLNALNISILVYPTVDHFNYDLFYKHLVNGSMQDGFIAEFIEDGYATADALFDSLKVVAQSRDFVKRKIFYFGDVYNKNYDEIKDEGTFFNVEMYRFIKHRKLNRNVKLDPKSMRPVFPYKQQRDDLSLEEPEASDGGREDVTYLRSKRDLQRNEEFVNALTSNPRPYGFKLLYVGEPRSSSHFLLKPQFLLTQDALPAEAQGDQPGPKRYELFAYFWEHCRREQKVLVCTYVHSKWNRHHLVELTPDSHNGAPCFAGTYLAWSGETRRFMPHLKTEDRPPSERGVNLNTALQVVEALSIKDGGRPFIVVNEDEDRKRDKLKDLLFSTEWPDEGRAPYYPEREDIVTRLGAELTENFKREYVSAALKRKRTAAKK